MEEPMLTPRFQVRASGMMEKMICLNILPPKILQHASLISQPNLFVTPENRD